MSTVSDIMALWPSRQALADDIGAPVARVHKWAQFQSIPGEYDVQLVEAAKARGHELTFEALARARARTESAA